MVAMETVATHLDEPTGFFVNHWQLLERIERAEQEPRPAHRRRRRARRRPPRPPRVPRRRTQTGAEAADFDPEVAAIFTDEATELIDASEHALVGLALAARAAPNIASPSSARCIPSRAVRAWPASRPWGT